MKGAASSGPIVARTQLRLLPDPSRTLSRLFVPGQETLIRGSSRAKVVVDRVLEMSNEEVEATLAATMTRFAGRHRDLEQVFDLHYGLISGRLGRDISVTRSRQLLIGAYFTQEYALEAAALFNPSLVAHPDQSGCGPGEVRFIMSLRAVGEGHLSCIEFRSGTIGPDGQIRFDPPGRFLTTGRPVPVTYQRDLLRAKFTDVGHEDETVRSFWSMLPAQVSGEELETALHEFSHRHQAHGGSVALVDTVRWMAGSNYAVEFDARDAISERVLWPQGRAESHGMEDARFVRFSDGGDVVYYATYTAFDGAQVSPQLVETRDFLTFTVTQLSGPSVRNKGMALFPRYIAGRYAALSRWDRESNSIAYSDDSRRWGAPVAFQAPTRPWQIVQLGNCGPPLETPAGWLVLTHGVGPVREYRLGAVLLDLDEPERLIASLPEPLLVADESEREGYVPNVVYSCGALLHGETVILPYGCGDSSVRLATIDLPRLLDRLLHG